ncbi:hypothetical protein P152DRAFT_449235 [Eremomyces bilateralis CBS 781.70]|uniref:Uncharacterized protein n=1 Tax=Eremomyces bilateralis CBS 781.70 TaxID=1392243 RepID=A0A6G1G3B1_9PEZI|nr:uncharacterized protein P152DRAFT_449235 [Eremomyces bilateralis CBS 781.70]KAF1812498.1 hypothetical protein P152DRAFT_449235 [Eremomyces bilateralis CBS 781.70]
MTSEIDSSPTASNGAMPGYANHYPPADDLSSSRMLSTSVGSLSSSRHQQSQIAKTYRQAAQLFLTRRLPEALSTIEPVITPQLPEGSADVPFDTHEDSQKPRAVAPIASASRGTRIKVWSFYLTFLNAVVELGHEEGKHAFGSSKWRALVAKARDGSVWEEVVQNGYGGSESDVDPDVVINLATLLLTHCPAQTLNQQRLETYLSATANPTFDITSRLSSSQGLHHIPKRYSPPTPGGGTSTPRDLNTRLKLLELYTLHVLPRNGEWEYSREFIMMSEVLDDERKEAFLAALHSLKEEREQAEERERELEQSREEEMEARRRETEKEADEERKRLQQLEKDEQRRRQDEKRRRAPVQPDAVRPESRPNPISRSSGAAREDRPARRPRKAPPSLYKRFGAMFGALQTLLLNTAQGLRARPLALLQTLLLLLAFALAVGNREIRERVKRIVSNAWQRLRQTVGMGVKSGDLPPSSPETPPVDTQAASPPQQITMRCGTGLSYMNSSVKVKGCYDPEYVLDYPPTIITKDLYQELRCPECQVNARYFNGEMIRYIKWCVGMATYLRKMRANKFEYMNMKHVVMITGTPLSVETMKALWEALRTGERSKFKVEVSYTTCQLHDEGVGTRAMSDVDMDLILNNYYDVIKVIETT